MARSNSCTFSQPPPHSDMVLFLPHALSQDLINHVSSVKEGKESMKNEVFLALHNKGEEEAKERCAAVPHTVKIWHGRCVTWLQHGGRRRHSSSSSSADVAPVLCGLCCVRAVVFRVLHAFIFYHRGLVLSC